MDIRDSRFLIKGDKVRFEIRNDQGHIIADAKITGQPSGEFVSIELTNIRHEDLWVTSKKYKKGLVFLAPIRYITRM